MIEESGAGGERSTAILLFTDLVGSTELRSRLGEEAAEDVRRKHDRLVTDAIEANRGRLVKNLGDGVMAAFTGASDAAGAAVRIQQAIDRHNRSHPSPALPDVRIGVSAGDVTFEEGDCFGTPVIEAARLCGNARGGQILVTEVVRLLAGSGGGHEFTPVGALDLKGLPAPLPACAVDWEPLRVSSVPLPTLLTDIGRIFVGREAQVERLEQLWKEAAAGELRVGFLAGEPGVGKTRLAAELGTAVYGQGGMVLAGRCDEDLGVPYQPFVQALRQFVEHTPAAELSVRLGRFGGELVRLVPELADRTPGLPPSLRSDPDTERYRLFDAVATWLAAVGAEEPLLLVLDDLQWAAKPTLLLLRHVARAPDAKRVFVLGTYRDTELGHDHPLIEVLADLRRQSGVERFSLPGLDQAGVAAFLERAAGHELDEEDLALARAIHEETEGNPFFVGEVFRHLDETGAIERREGRWATRRPVEEIGIPEGVREVVGRRLSRLSEEANRALRLAAVVGTEFEFPVVQAAGGFEEEALLSALEEATETRLVIEGSAVARYRFAHALVRDALYDELSGARRAAVHRRVAEVIETIHGARLDDHLPALAHHYARASGVTAGTTKAVAYASRAGDRALAQLAHDEAIGYYRQALDLLELAGAPVDDSRRQELLISLGDAQRRAGDPSHRQTLLEAAHLARGRGDAGALARAALTNLRGYFQASAGSVDAERVAVLEAALEAMGDSEPATRARLLASLALELVDRGDRRRCARLSDEALALARRLDDPGALAAVLTARYFTISGPDTLAQRTADTAELLAVAHRLGDPVTICLALSLRARLAVEGGDGAEAEAYLAQAEQLAADLGQAQLRWFTTLHRAGLELLSGRIDEAERLNREQLRLGQAADTPEALVVFAGNLLLLGLERGDVAEVEEAVRQATVRLPGLPSGTAMLAVLYCDLGRHNEARDLVTAAEQAATWQPHNHMWLWALALYAAACARLGHTSGARALHDLLAPYPEQVVVAWGVPLGSLSYSVALIATTLGRFEEAEARFGTAAATHARLGAPIWLARTRFEWARMLLARRQPGDAERARELLGQALATARELHLANVERRAAELLA